MNPLVGIGLAISIPLIIGALTVDKIARFYNRVTASHRPGAREVPRVRYETPGHRNWGSYFRRRHEAPPEYGEPRGRLPRKTPTGLSKIFEVNPWRRFSSRPPESNAPPPPMELQVPPRREREDRRASDGAYGKRNRGSRISRDGHDLERGQE